MRCPPRSLALVLVLPLVSAACFHRLLASPGSLIADGARASVDHADRAAARGIGNDLTSVFLPRFCYIVGRIRENGRRPAWDASGFGGRPLVSNPQSGINYPPVWVAWWTGLPASLGWLTVAHLLGAGLGVYVLSRSLGFGGPASVVAGGCYQASPYLIAHAMEGHYPHVWSACWYPWAFWGLSLTRRRNAVGYLVVPAVLSMTFLTGHPQEWYYLVLAMTVWVLADAYQSARDGSARVAVSAVLLWGGMLALSLGLCAAELAPELAVQPWLLKKSAIPLEHLNHYQLRLDNVPQLLSPFALGRPDDYFGHDNYWETVFSIGLAPLVLAVLGVTTFTDRGLVRRWGTLVTVAVVFATGRKLGIYSLAYAVLPGMERFRVPSRTLFLASLGASVLAGAGIESLLTARFSKAEWDVLRSRVRKGLAGAGLFAVVIGLGLTPGWQKRVPSPIPRPGTEAPSTSRAIRDDRPGYMTAGGGIFAASLLGLTGLMSIRVGPRSGPAGTAWGLGAIGLVELVLYAQTLLVCTPVSAFLGGRALGGGREVVKDERSGPSRIASVGSLFPDLGAVSAGLEKTNVNDGFQIQHAADLYERLYPILEQTYFRTGGERPMDAAVDHYQGTIAQSVLDLMSVRYLVSDRRVPLESFETSRDGRLEGHEPTLLWNRTALPRAYVVPGVALDDGVEGLEVGRRLSELDPRAVVLMDHDPLGGACAGRQGFTPAEWVSHDPDEVTVRVETTAPGLLVVGNTWMPGWSATLDGSPAAVLRGNHWQQVVPIVKAGRHEIRLRYQPPGLEAAVSVTAASLVAWGGIGLTLLTRRAGNSAPRGFAARLASKIAPV